MKKITILCATLTATVAFAQSNRTFVNAEIKDSHLEVVVNDGTYHIETLPNDAFNIQFFPTGTTEYEGSHAVVANPKSINTTLDDHGNHLHLSNGALTLNIEKSPFYLSFSHKGQTILKEHDGYYDHDTLKGFSFDLKPDEVLYGGGERALGMNHRGHRLELYNQASYGYGTHAELMYYSMPVILSSANYLLLWDNPRRGFLDLGKTEENVMKIEANGGRMAYTVVGGENPQQVTENYTQLTGLQPLPPRWSLGNFASRFGYHSQNEVEQVVAAFDKNQIPLDGVVLDIFWFGPEIFNHMGTLDWYTDSFPNGPKMVNDLAHQGVNTILISEPFILTTSKRWEEAVAKDLICKNDSGKPYTYKFYFGNTGLLDIFKPEAKDWLWDIYKTQRQQGVAGWWCDLGEPEVHPSDLLHVNGKADDVHAIYGHYWAKTIFDGMRKDFAGERPLILMRSGFAGTQRFGVVTWSGDVQRDWGGLQSQPEIALQMGMQGLAYHHSDLGGFAGSKRDAELYVRWLQYGVFQPVFRPHAQEEVPSEPVFWEDSVMQLAKKAVQLRYQLTPYNYTLSYQNSTKGTPLMRPLRFEEPKNPELFTYDDAYLWGPNFLVAPVVDSAAKKMDIYFPKTADWINYYNGNIVEGGTTKTVDLTLNNIPVYVRSGAFITTVPVVEHLKDYTTDTLQLDLFLAGKPVVSENQFYDDNGLSSTSIEDQAYDLFTYRYTPVQGGGSQLTISKTGNGYVDGPKSRIFKCRIHHPGFTAGSIVVNDQKTRAHYNESLDIFEFELVYNSQDIVVQIAGQ